MDNQAQRLRDLRTAKRVIEELMDGAESEDERRGRLLELRSVMQQINAIQNPGADAGRSQTPAATSSTPNSASVPHTATHHHQNGCCSGPPPQYGGSQPHATPTTSSDTSQAPSFSGAIPWYQTPMFPRTMSGTATPDSGCRTTQNSLRTSDASPTPTPTSTSQSTASYQQPYVGTPSPAAQQHSYGGVPNPVATNSGPSNGQYYSPSIPTPSPNLRFQTPQTHSHTFSSVHADDDRGGKSHSMSDDVGVDGVSQTPHGHQDPSTRSASAPAPSDSHGTSEPRKEQELGQRVTDLRHEPRPCIARTPQKASGVFVLADRTVPLYALIFVHNGRMFELHCPYCHGVCTMEGKREETAHVLAGLKGLSIHVSSAHPGKPFYWDPAWVFENCVRNALTLEEEQQVREKQYGIFMELVHTVRFEQGSLGLWRPST